MRNAPPDAAVRRFVDDLTGLTGPDMGRVGLAVSGGPDSLALLLLAHHAGVACVAATVDHGLRPDSAAEADHVSLICAELGVEHAILTLGVPEKGNLSDWARGARYAALHDWRVAAGCDWLLTAHHADDQLETMIMRLNRGAGLAGLSGIRARRGQIIRPLLAWRKTELESIVAECGYKACVDPSNSDDRFDRARLRKALAGADWLDPQAAARSAAALGEAEIALQWMAEGEAAHRVVEQHGGVSFDFKGLPRELLRRIVLICLDLVQPGAAPRGDELDRLIHGLCNGRTATLSGVKCKGGDVWMFTPAPARQKN